MVDRSVPNSLYMWSRLMFLSLNAQTGLSFLVQTLGVIITPLTLFTAHTCGEHEIIMSTDSSSNKSKERKHLLALNINATSN